MARKKYYNEGPMYRQDVQSAYESRDPREYAERERRQFYDRGIKSSRGFYGVEDANQRESVYKQSVKEGPTPGDYENAERRQSYKEQYRHMAGEARRYNEMSAAGMINEDHSQIANLPQQVRMEKYPYGYSYEPEEYDDTIRGVDRQLAMDDGKRNRHWNPHKY